MATKKLYIDANTGVMLIANQSLDITSSVLTEPKCYVNDLYFHSGLNYIQIKGNIIAATTVTFPLLERTLKTWDDPTSKSGHL